MTLGVKLYHHRLHDFEAFDRIELEVVPRYKTSGLSGDEWRYSVAVRLYFKGLLIHEQSFGDMQTAMAHLPTLPDQVAVPFPEEWLEHERVMCDQAGCPNQAAGRYQIKRQTASNGQWLDEEETPFEYYRQFCQTHARRGDCSREDADHNYHPLDSLTPDSSDNTTESPSVFGGVIDMTDEPL